VNVTLLRSTWHEAAGHGDIFVQWFYAQLFFEHPELRDLFGADMAAQRAKLTDTLDLVVAGADNLEAVVPKLRKLGRMHRRFRVTVDMYPAVGQALLATFARFLDDAWTPEAANTWANAYGLVSGVMIDAHREADAGDQRAVWDVLILDIWRDPTVLHLVLDPEGGYPWEPGAPVDVRLADRPGTWRTYNTALDHPTILVPVNRVDTPLDGVTLALLSAAPGDHLWLAPPVDPIDQEARP
jgi:hemoglobin-like flavoprotein